MKLYRFSDESKDYWESWEESPGTYTVHWGALGTTGESKTIHATSPHEAERLLNNEMDDYVERGFKPIEPEDHAILLIEFGIEGMGTTNDLSKRHRLEDRMNETMGWTGLGECDGGSIGSGTMEVCCFVVDFDLAKQVIEGDLVGTEFADFTRIYQEGID